MKNSKAVYYLSFLILAGNIFGVPTSWALNSYTLKECENPAPDNRIAIWETINSESRFRKECAPDILYSWGSESKLNYYLNNQSSQDFLPITGNHPLFLWRTPVGTFAYGPIAIRIKLKSNVKFKQVSMANYACSMGLSASERQDTVAVYYWKNNGSGVDFILCSSGPVHSWSFGLPEHLEEMKREYDWIQTHDDTEYDLYYKKNGKDLLFDINLDQKNWSQKILESNLDKMETWVENGEGRIFFNQEVTESTREFHFLSHFALFSVQD